MSFAEIDNADRTDRGDAGEEAGGSTRGPESGQRVSMGDDSASCGADVPAHLHYGKTCGTWQKKIRLKIRKTNCRLARPRIKDSQMEFPCQKIGANWYDGYRKRPIRS